MNWAEEEEISQQIKYFRKKNQAEQESKLQDHHLSYEIIFAANTLSLVGLPYDLLKTLELYKLNFLSSRQ